MAISDVVRVRVIMDLLQNGDVANEAAYANVDLIDLSTGLKYVNAFWDVYGDESIADPTNQQKVELYIREMRRFHRMTLRQARVPAVRAAAGKAEEIIVDNEAAADLGS